MTMTPTTTQDSAAAPTQVKTENPEVLANLARASTRSEVQYSDSVETWRNVINGRVIVDRKDLAGNVKSEMVRSGLTFTVTPDERRINEAAMISDDLNPYRNGTLQPVMLVKDHPDNEAILANPNHLPDDDPGQIFELKGEAFLERVMVISNPQALERLIELAEEPANHCYVVQLRWMERKLAQLVQPITQVKPESADRGTGAERDTSAIRAVSPM